MKMRSLGWSPRSAAAVLSEIEKPQAWKSASQGDSGHTLSPMFSWTVLSLKSSWGTFMKMQDLVATVTALSAVTVGLLTLRKAHD